MAKAVARAKGAGVGDQPRLPPAAYSDLAGTAGWETARNCGKERGDDSRRRIGGGGRGWKAFCRAVWTTRDVNTGSIFWMPVEERCGRTGRPETWMARKEPEKEFSPPFRRPPGGNGPPWSL